MKIKQFEYVYEIARCKSITLAAQKLFISQQALSETLKLLEEELQFPIFNRTKKGVTLTDEGKVFLKDIEKILALVHSWEKLSIKQDRKKEVKIIVQNLLKDIILIDNLKEDIEKRGNISVKWDTDSIPNLMKRLSSNDPCVVIMTASPRAIVYTKIMQLKVNERYTIKGILSEEDSQMQLIFRKDDPLALKEKIKLAELSGDCLAVNDGVAKIEIIMQIVEATNTSPYILPHSINAVDFIVQRKGHFACLPKFIAKNNVHVLNNNVCVRDFKNKIDPGFECYLLSNMEDAELLQIIEEEMVCHLLPRKK